MHKCRGKPPHTHITFIQYSVLRNGCSKILDIRTFGHSIYHLAAWGFKYFFVWRLLSCIPHFSCNWHKKNRKNCLNWGATQNSIIWFVLKWPSKLLQTAKLWVAEENEKRESERESRNSTWQLGSIFNPWRRWKTDERQVSVVKGSSDHFSCATLCDVLLTDR